MKQIAYYNEIDPFAAEWLRELIRRNVIAPGDVDETPIEEVDAAKLVRYIQCHWFAGIGVWSHALRSAGWPDTRPVWTGSCPCPSFSAAGQGKGLADARHLWPHWAKFIRKRKPPVIFAEQVDDSIAHGWLDVVQAELEACAYAVGKIVFTAASVGAPQISSRLFIVAEADETGSVIERETRVHDHGAPGDDTHGRSATGGVVTAKRRRREQRDQSERRIQITDTRSATGGLLAEADSNGQSARRRDDGEVRGLPQEESETENSSIVSGGSGATHGMGAALSTRLEGHAGNGNHGHEPRRLFETEAGPVAAAGPLGGFWGNAEWIYCSDGKHRPTEPGLFPLAHGITGRVGRLRGYGNALVAPQAQAFIEAYMKRK